MPPRSLTGTVLGAAAALWWLLLGLLFVLTAPAGSALGLGFWLGTVLAAASGFGWGAALGPPLARRRRQSARSQAAGLVRFAAAGAVALLLAGATALLAGLLLTALTSGVGATWDAVRLALARPAALALPLAAVVLIGAPFGAAAGVVLHALAGASRGDDDAAGIGSRPRSPR